MADSRMRRIGSPHWPPLRYHSMSTAMGPVVRPQLYANPTNHEWNAWLGSIMNPIMAPMPASTATTRALLCTVRMNAGAFVSRLSTATLLLLLTVVSSLFLGPPPELRHFPESLKPDWSRTESPGLQEHWPGLTADLIAAHGCTQRYSSDRSVLPAPHSRASLRIRWS